MGVNESILEELKKLNGQRDPVLTSGRPSVINIVMPAADTEYPDGGHILPKGCKRYYIHCKDGTAFRMAFETDKVADSVSPYLTVKTDSNYWEDNLNLEDEIIFYFASASTSKVIEIIQWS